MSASLHVRWCTTAFIPRKRTCSNNCSCAQKQQQQQQSRFITLGGTLVVEDNEREATANIVATVRDEKARTKGATFLLTQQKGKGTQSCLPSSSTPTPTPSTSSPVVTTTRISQYRSWCRCCCGCSCGGCCTGLLCNQSCRGHVNATTSRSLAITTASSCGRCCCGGSSAGGA